MLSWTLVWGLPAQRCFGSSPRQLFFKAISRSLSLSNYPWWTGLYNTKPNPLLKSPTSRAPTARVQHGSSSVLPINLVKLWFSNSSSTQKVMGSTSSWQPLYKILFLLNLAHHLAHASEKYISAIGDPGMKNPNVRVALEAWNFCNEVGIEAPKMGSPRLADCADLYCPSIVGMPLSQPLRIPLI